MEILLQKLRKFYARRLKKGKFYARPMKKGKYLRKLLRKSYEKGKIFKKILQCGGQKSYWCKRSYSQSQPLSCSNSEKMELGLGIAGEDVPLGTRTLPRPCRVKCGFRIAPPPIHDSCFPARPSPCEKKAFPTSPSLPMSIPQYPDTYDGTFNPYHYPGQVARGGWDAQVRLGLWILREGQLVRR